MGLGFAWCLYSNSKVKRRIVISSYMFSRRSECINKILSRKLGACAPSLIGFYSIFFFPIVTAPIFLRNFDREQFKNFFLFTYDLEKNPQKRAHTTTVKKLRDWKILFLNTYCYKRVAIGAPCYFGASFFSLFKTWKRKKAAPPISGRVPLWSGVLGFPTEFRWA